MKVEIYDLIRILERIAKGIEQNNQINMEMNGIMKNIYQKGIITFPTEK